MVSLDYIILMPEYAHQETKWRKKEGVKNAFS